LRSKARAAKGQADFIAFGETIGPSLTKDCLKTLQAAGLDGKRAAG